MNIKNKTKPKTKRSRNLAKKRLKKYEKQSLKISERYQRNIANDIQLLESETTDDEIEGIIRDEDGKRAYPEHHDFDDSHLDALKRFTWVGMITIKFYHRKYNGDDKLGFSRNRRFDFGNQLMENLCNRLFGVKKSQMVWAITDEFGLSGEGHIHIVFSFDNLNPKGRERVSKIHFEDDLGEFHKMGKDSAEEYLRILNNNGERDKISRGQINFNWKAQWDNAGLSRYMTKLEHGRPNKEFHLHNIIPVESELLVAK